MVIDAIEKRTYFEVVPEGDRFRVFQVEVSSARVIERMYDWPDHETTFATKSEALPGCAAQRAVVAAGGVRRGVGVRFQG